LLLAGGGIEELHKLQQQAQTVSERLLLAKLQEASNILEEQEAVSAAQQQLLLFKVLWGFILKRDCCVSTEKELVSAAG
jgi:hypothetical protein